MDVDKRYPRKVIETDPAAELGFTNVEPRPRGVLPETYEHT